MQQSEEQLLLNKATSALESLKQQLNEVTSGQFAQKERLDIKTQIEEHFKQCYLKLAAREMRLLDEADHAFSHLQNQTQSQLQKQIEGCIKIMEASSSLQSSPEAFKLLLQGVGNVVPTKYTKEKLHISFSFPDSFLEVLSSHGKLSATFGLSEVPSSSSIEGTLADLKRDYDNTAKSTERLGFVHTIKSIKEDISRLDSLIAQMSQQGSNNEAQQLQQITQNIALHDSAIYRLEQRSNTHEELISQHQQQLARSAARAPLSRLRSLSASSGFLDWHVVGLVSTLAGSSDGYREGSGQTAKFSDPFYLCLNPLDDCLYVCDSLNNTIRKITQQGEVSNFAAKPGDGQLKCPKGIAFYRKDKCFYVCSSEQHSIKRISSSGKITTVAGSGAIGCADGFGVKSSFNWPLGIAIDQNTGNMYITDGQNNVIRRVSQLGEVSTVVGNGTAGYNDGIGRSAQFSGPGGICFDEKTNSLVISDGDNGKLRKIMLENGVVSTLCDISYPSGLSLAPQGAFLVSSRDMHKVMIVSPKEETYEVRTIAGSGLSGNEDGEPLICKFNEPRGVIFDSKTNTCFVVDSANHRVRKFHLVNVSLLE